MTARSTEASRIQAARDYVAKLRSMNPSRDVSKALDDLERELDERQEKLSAPKRRELAGAHR